MTLNYTIKNNKYNNINQILKQEFHISSRLQHKLITYKHVFLNGKPIDTRISPSLNDIITINLDFNEKSDNIIANKIDLSIIYEDDALLIINKPAGIATHPSMKHYNNSLSNGVKYYFETINLNRKIRPVNRLDLNTSGLIVFAKNEYIQESLIQQMRNNIFYKEYIAIVNGHFKQKKGIIDLPITRKPNSIIERCISDTGQNAITKYEVIKTCNSFSYIKCILETGRTHQIRVHMSAINHPLLGDTLYGSSSNLINRQALHCYKIKFIHPITGKMLEFVCQLPDDMKF